MKDTHEHKRAFTLIELVVVIVVVAILAACLVPALARTRPQAQRIACANNLKQVGLAFRTWAAAHGGLLRFSRQVLPMLMSLADRCPKFGS